MSENSTPTKPELRETGSLLAIKTAIKKKFGTDDGSIDIRHLWSIEDMHRFRVNWWVSGCIVKSKFVVVTGHKIEERIS